MWGGGGPILAFRLREIICEEGGVVDFEYSKSTLSIWKVIIEDLRKSERIGFQRISIRWYQQARVLLPEMLIRKRRS